MKVLQNASSQLAALKRVMPPPASTRFKPSIFCMNGPHYAEPLAQGLIILLGLKRTVVVNLDLQYRNGLLHGSNFGLYIL